MCIEIKGIRLPSSLMKCILDVNKPLVTEALRDSLHRMHIYTQDRSLSFTFSIQIYGLQVSD